MPRQTGTSAPGPTDGANGARLIDDHLAALGSPQRETLSALRKTLRSILPHADEAIKYGMPCFVIRGKGVAGYEGFKGHCSYFPMSGSVLEQVPGIPTGWATTKGTMQFPIDKPPAVALVRRLVKARLAEISDVRDGLRLDFFADGSIKAEGSMRSGELHGAWRWYRRDGSVMRSGRFRDGDQIGLWETYSPDGKLVKATTFGGR